MMLPGMLLLLEWPNAMADTWFFEDVDYGRLSVGGHATYFRPKDADAGSWYGGAQVRLHFSRIFALEALADYRRNDFGTTRSDTYPVQGSLLAYLLPGKRLSPFILGERGGTTRK